MGWDGLGLSSYLLVIYYRRAKANNSGIMTVLTNRAGDGLILIRIAYLITIGNWNLLFYRINKFPSVLIILLIAAACTKRAQIPFSAWLPAAMAAPTPVSSLVHSSTLVTAGVYILIRHGEIFLLNFVSPFLIITGASTIVIARTRALFETDLKKIVALSTLRQLGIMVLRLGLGAIMIRFFHLLGHAFFKALLFLRAGAIIHSSKDYQDLRLAGNSSHALPITSGFTLVARFSLIGAPYMSAFFSKELVLEIILVLNINSMAYHVILLGVGLTAIYGRRFLILVFIRPRHSRMILYKLDESKIIIKRIIILFLPAIIRGFFLNFILNVSFKARAVARIIKTSLFTALVILVLLITKHRFSSTKNNWWGLTWGLTSMWALPTTSSSLPVVLSSKIRAMILKFFDRGALNIKLVWMWRYFNTSSLGFSSLNFVYKILRLVMIWGVIIIIFYLCNKGYNKLNL